MNYVKLRILMRFMKIVRLRVWLFRFGVVEL